MGYLQPERQFLDKVNDLFMTINLRHGVMQLGDAASGKTQCLYGLMNALNHLNKREVDERLEKFNKLIRQSPGELISHPDFAALADDY